MFRKAVLRASFLGLLAACVTSAPVIVRADWILVPTRHGRSEVIPRGEYAEWLSSHSRRRSSSLGHIPPNLLDAPGVIHVGVGNARAFLLIDEPVAGMRLSGGSAQVFWGLPYEIDSHIDGRWVQRKGADIFIQGVSPGESELLLQLRDGTVRRFVITSP